MTRSSCVPDPTEDLHWSDFRGAIQDIFDDNSKSFPDRLCVIETPSSTSPLREFTYKQINEASNVIAHHLLHHDVERDEVVMVYAYRGVELVVAIMGILKAGATFSVIDPLYPPDRQAVYLDVARPRALIIIEKALVDAGKLASSVRDFISTHLNLRTEIPCLNLHGNGHLTGGIMNNHDCLQEQQILREKNPRVLVGPDSTPTLSFTSGSEGRPKGVKGRHFSLTYYFPWMSETFDLGRDANERFTMLSGIAHDPIQRDIFTPLFLGALLVIPAKEDIQYEKLAEWMRKYGATVTHLTPAMGQILVGGAAVQFPALKNAFFVGDILLKRDCRRLQELAPNVNIVNMYGTTETQRSVSFYRIPSFISDSFHLERLGDVVPAGKGMKDVQLLVVSRDDKNRICDVGEPGEIFVRAGGLAEEYLDQEELSKKKFLPNWFCDPYRWIQKDQNNLKAQKYAELWRQFYGGPRDRLYRSGDIGRYRADGNVECIGRIDSQVKIRGYRIELGDIDTHLSQHPLIRENVTLVRRNKDEEPTLVSYVVPDLQKWHDWLQSKGMREEASGEHMVQMLKRFHPLCEDARAHLRKKIPNYAIPAVFVPLSRMPLNPNGKIDKPALPFPEPDELLEALSRKQLRRDGDRSATEIIVAEIWAKHIPRRTSQSIEPSDNFLDIGGDSITAQKIIFDIRKRFGDLDVFTRDLTSLRNFSASIEQARNPIGYRLEPSDIERCTVQQETDYFSDAQDMVQELPDLFPIHSGSSIDHYTVLLTGSTGFLGAYILRDLLTRRNPSIHVIVLVRASDPSEAAKRVRNTCKAFGIWSDDYKNRIEYVVGDLERPKLGLEKDMWDVLVNSVDTVIHNGARVHWVWPYSMLKAANVQSTVALLQLCAAGKGKRFGFVSSTSVLDSEHYFNLSEDLMNSEGRGISESDDLSGSCQGLATGYGQSKWVSEYLIREAGRRGLNGCIIRPGYITGDTKNGTSVTDDFLLRLLKGCVQLKLRPNIDNSVNMVPVDHVARIVVASTFQPPVLPLGTVHVTSTKRLRLNEYLGLLETYGYEAPRVEYDIWRDAVKSYVSDGEQHTEFSLLPLLDMVTRDLPTSTKAPELDDSNAKKVLEEDAAWSGCKAGQGSGVTSDLVGLYISYLNAIGFMPAPPHKQGKSIPILQLSADIKNAWRGAGGRGGDYRE